MTAITDNAAKHRYELVEQGQTAYADYRLAEDRLFIDYVFSPPALRGAGTAGRLMAGLAADARARGLKITPICGYAAAWLSRHPDFADLTG
ncbi:putative GNAT family acetyltransferase [Caulobacter ginsengisoli]|uniref:GNAT family acetyltransferase n=1 Tax=Caulobacter ginsengisoli TaxID=400775 RepID=A0ABU0IMU5_9CAUL|nr:GNAT family N-acetyltransferase [Caulobacter ginsengisoli]MDQ0463343.1 putative GNAT family acetyltransferase [Caulobacter ginsengisoli]